MESASTAPQAMRMDEAGSAAREIAAALLNSKDGSTRRALAQLT